MSSRPRGVGALPGASVRSRLSEGPCVGGPPRETGPAEGTEPPPARCAFRDSCLVVFVRLQSFRSHHADRVPTNVLVSKLAPDTNTHSSIFASPGFTSRKRSTFLAPPPPPSQLSESPNKDGQTAWRKWRSSLVRSPYAGEHTAETGLQRRARKAQRRGEC